MTKGKENQTVQLSFNTIKAIKKEAEKQTKKLNIKVTEHMLRVKAIEDVYGK